MPKSNSLVEHKATATQDQKRVVTLAHINTKSTEIACTQGFFHADIKQHLLQDHSFPPEIAEIIISYLEFGNEKEDLAFLQTIEKHINEHQASLYKGATHEQVYVKLATLANRALEEAAENCFRKSMIFLLKLSNDLHLARNANLYNTTLRVYSYNINTLITHCCSTEFPMEHKVFIKASATETLRMNTPKSYSLITGTNPQLWCNTTYNGNIQITDDSTINTLLTNLSGKPIHAIPKSPLFNQQLKNAIVIYRAKLLAETVNFLLIQPGADVNYVDEYGRSQLTLAALHGNPYIINVLLCYGANPLLIDHYDDRPDERFNHHIHLETALARTMPVKANHYHSDDYFHNIYALKFCYFKSPCCTKLLLQYSLAFSITDANYPTQEARLARSELRYLIYLTSASANDKNHELKIKLFKQIVYYHDCYKTIMDKKLIAKFEKHWDKNKSPLENTLSLTKTYLTGNEISGWRNALPNAEFLFSQLVILENTACHSESELNSRLLTIVEQTFDLFESASTFPAMLFWIESKIHRINWVMPQVAHVKEADASHDQNLEVTSPTSRHDQQQQHRM